MSVQVIEGDNLERVKSLLRESPRLPKYFPHPICKHPATAGEFRTNVLAQTGRLTFEGGHWTERRSTTLIFQPNDFRVDTLSSIKWSHDHLNESTGLVRSEEMTSDAVSRHLELGANTRLDITRVRDGFREFHLTHAPIGSRITHSLTYNHDGTSWTNEVEGDEKTLLELLEYRSSRGEIFQPKGLLADPTMYYRVGGHEIWWDRKTYEELVDHVIEKSRIEDIARALGRNQPVQAG